MNEFYTKSYLIDTTHVDQMNNIRPSVMLSFFQDMATDHAAIMGISRDYLARNYNACWLVARTWYKLSRPLKVGKTVTIKTWHRGVSPLIVYRDFDLFVEDELVGEGVSGWVVADIDDRKMLRPESVAEIVSSPVPETVKEKTLRPIRRPKDAAHVYARTVRYSDLDLNGHMNNTRYADLVLDAFTPEEMEGRFIAEMQLNYSQECKWGETMEVARKMDGDSCYIDGCCGDSQRRFEANLQFQKEC